jgi:ectoine hydroxylase-related dioxygenase (phytanoyl-CoA dioxygenase family)
MSAANMKSVSTFDVDDLRDQLDGPGYAVVRNVVPKAPLSRLADELAEAYGRFEGFKGGGSITGHLNCFPGRNARFVYDSVAEQGLVDAVQALRPDRPNSVRATMNYNLPGSVAQHYHMDGLYVEDFLICNVAVIDTDLVNGAIDLLPGSNQQFLPFWKYAMQRTYRSSTRVEMEQGDVLLRRSILWHRGMPNKSATPRPMMSLTFGEVSAPADDPFATFNGDIVFTPNWYSTSRMGALRERTFATAPVAYSAYRFGKSLTGKRGYSSY